MTFKKIAALLLAGSEVLFSSCSEKNGTDIPTTSMGFSDEIVAELTSVRGEAETRSYNVPVYEVRWNEGDRISVVNADGLYAEYTLKEGANTTSGVFHIDGDKTMVPTRATEAFSPASLGETMIWPSYITESDAMPMYGTIDSGSDTDHPLQFKSLGSVVNIVFNSRNQDATLQKITLSADQPLSGAFTVDAEGKAVLASDADGAVSLGFGAEGLVLSSTKEYSFYLYVPSGDYTNFTVSFTASGLKTLEYNYGSKSLLHNTLSKMTAVCDFQYTVTFDTRWLATEETIPAAQQVSYGGLVTKPASPEALLKEHFIFAGWYKDEGRTEPWDFENDKVTGDVTLYAKWYRIEKHESYIAASDLMYMDDYKEFRYLLIRKNSGTTFIGDESDLSVDARDEGITITSVQGDMLFTEVKVICQGPIFTEQDDWDLTWGSATWSDELGATSVTFKGYIEFFKRLEFKCYRLVEEI